MCCQLSIEASIFSTVFFTVSSLISCATLCRTVPIPSAGYAESMLHHSSRICFLIDFFLPLPSRKLAWALAIASIGGFFDNTSSALVKTVLYTLAIISNIARLSVNVIVPVCLTFYSKTNSYFMVVLSQNPEISWFIWIFNNFAIDSVTLTSPVVKPT